MATTIYNGNVDGKANNGTSGSYTFYLEVILNSQNVINNTSNITINHYAKGNIGFNYEQYSTPKSYIKIYDNNTDSTVTKKTTTVKAIGSSKAKIGTWTGDITHKLDGTLTIKVTADYKPNDSTWYLPADKSLNSGNLVLDPLHMIPEINSVSFIENNPTLISAGISNDTFVARLSNKTVTADVTYYDDATFTNLKNVVATTIYDNDTNPAVIDLANCSIGSNQVLILTEITDSLDAKGILGLTKDAIPYTLPTLIPTSSSVKRNGQGTGKAKMSLKGTFYNNNIGNITNGITLSFAYAEKGQQPVLYHTIPSTAYTISGNEITMQDWAIAINGEEITDLIVDKAYTFRIKIQDNLNKEETIDLICPNGEYLMCYYEDRIDFKKITANNIQSGRETITPVANTPTSYDVVFDKKFETAPIVVATAVTTSPGTVVLGVSVGNITTTGFKLWLTRTNATDTSINWIAIGI